MSEKLEIKPLLGLLGVLLTAMGGEFNGQVSSSALVDILGGLSLSHDPGTWIRSLYVSGEVIGMIVAPWCSVTFSPRLFLMFVIALNLVTSALIPSTNILPLIYTLRVLQGLSGGLAIPLLMANALRVLSRPIRLYGLAVYALTATFTPNFAPTLAALWVDVVGWRFVFLQAIPILALAAALILYGMNGTAATLDVARANAQAATIEAALPALRISQARLINAIGLLLGETPRALTDELAGAQAQPDVPPAVPVGLPAGLLRQRPDIREAEARLHAATAQIGAAQADFYPDISLTGNFNLEGLQFKNMFAMPDRAFSVGPAVSLPIFEGGRLKGMLHLREAQQREAAIDFRKTVLTAWQEVDDAMTAYASLQEQRTALAIAEREDHRALLAAREQYVQGAADYLDVNTALAAELESRRAMTDNQMAVENALVQLYLALGGGWQLADAVATTP